MPSDLTLGAEYNYDGLEDEVIGYERYMKQKVRIAGTYLQNEWNCLLYTSPSPRDTR